ncbi:DUF1697 domain-containing protein [Streptococcus entericus]|uniref:DUF1697 domain-containing protein n=1 Tax=Streptococcus entericus TaxID=155680 RepID=UPI00037955B5|nr:DUF1697 domain-containing protein [Streptococcus entericus]
MKTYIVLLRGVMPSGKNSIKMAFLRDILEEAGFDNVRTYIQSGNVILKSPLLPKEISEKVHSVILDKNGSDLPVIVKTTDDIAQVLNENPFGEGYDIGRVFFTLSNEMPDEKLVQELENQDFGDEKIAFGKHAIYLYLPKDASRSKLSNVFVEKKLKITATTRNFNTLTKLVELARS